MTVSTYFQSIGLVKLAVVLALSRQLLFMVPCLIFLPPCLGLDGVWASLPVADIVAGMLTLICLYRSIKTKQLERSPSNLLPKDRA